MEALAALGLAGLLLHFWLPGLLVLVAVDGTAALTASALLRATGAHVAAEEAEEADDVEVAQRKVNAAFNFAFTGTLAVVPLVVGLVVETAGAPTALLIDAATFVACAALLGSVRPHAEDADGTSVRARLLAAWRYLNEMPQLRSLLLIEAVAVVFFASVEPVEVLYAKQTLAVGDRGYGVLVDVWGIGMVLGSIVFARAVRRPLGPMLVVGTLLVGLAYLGFARRPDACGRLRGGAGRRRRQRRAVAVADQRGPAAHAESATRPPDERGGIDRLALPRDRLRARRRDRRAQLPPRGDAGGGRGGDGDHGPVRTARELELPARAPRRTATVSASRPPAPRRGTTSGLVSPAGGSSSTTGRGSLRTTEHP